MSFLVDENISWRILRLIAGQFPNSQHVLNKGLQSSDDEDIWTYARKHNLTLMSKDDDMRALVESRGPPPKLIWLRSGNLSTAQIAVVILNNSDNFRTFLSGPDGILEIS